MPKLYLKNTKMSSGGEIGGGDGVYPQQTRKVLSPKKRKILMAEGNNRHYDPLPYGKECVQKLKEGQLVYVRDEQYGWALAIVSSVQDGLVHVVLQDYSTQTKQFGDVLLRSEDTDWLECSSLTEATPINEASVLECLHERFSGGVFYTTAGTTVVAVNPFKDIPSLYDVEMIHKYHHSQHCEVLSPHIYVIAKKAYADLTNQMGKVNQSIVVSGESGAGKTVSAKHLLRYLTVVSSPELENMLENSIPGSAIEQRVLDSNPILEAFGNAATPRNENSSRFGKFIQLQFHRNGFILGGVIQTYLLEKTRVVRQGMAENNFHIFYQLLSLADTPSLPPWLESMRTEVQRSQLRIAVPQQEETLAVMQTVDAMKDIGVTSSMQVTIFQILLAILHLTNINFVSSSDEESSKMSVDEESERSQRECCRLLGISSVSLQHTLLHRNIVSGSRARRSVFVKPVKVAEAYSRRDCLAMLLYSRVFDWLVSFINQQIKAPQFDHCINLLDIYGFETFDVNSLEQLCINYANERLQQFYVIHFLRDLQHEYEAEHIPWTSVAFKDNQTCVEALDGANGVFGVLNEEVHLSRNSKDNELCQRVLEASAKSGITRKRGEGQYQTDFYVRHYAGDVLYTVTEAVKKNKDNIPVELINLMGTSSQDFITDLFSVEDFAQTEQSHTPTKHKKKKTVLTKFKSSLDSLVSCLEQSESHYIRCIKPNKQNIPALFDRPYVLQQLQACGTLETVDICRMGYPARMMYIDFVCRYGVFIRLQPQWRAWSQLHGLSGVAETEGNKENDEDELFMQEVDVWLSQNAVHSGAARKMRRRSGTTLNEHSHKLSASIMACAFRSDELRRQGCHHQFGITKLFLTQKQLEHLEHTRASIVSTLVTCVQARWRAYLLRQQIQQMHAAASTIQAAWRGHSVRVLLRHRHKYAVLIQAYWRGFIQRKWMCRITASAQKIQRQWRVHILQQSLRKLAWSSKVMKRALGTWVHRRRFHLSLVALMEQRWIEEERRRCKLLEDEERQRLHEIEEETRRWRATQETRGELTHNDGAVGGNSAGPSAVFRDFSGLCRRIGLGQSNSNMQSSQFEQKTVPASEDQTDSCYKQFNAVEEVDNSDRWSDDSGVMIKDEFQSTHSTEAGSESAPLRKKMRLTRSDLQIGNGIITCRRLTKPGFRFHVKKSVLRHGHVLHRREFPSGLLDALPDR